MKTVLLFGLMYAAILSSSMVNGTAQESADGRQQVFHDELLDQLVGDWKLTRKFPTRTVENTFKAEWILNHQFLQLHMKDVGPQPGYEALVLIGYDSTSERYVAHWIDIYGGRVSESLGYGTRTGSSIKFVFEYAEGPFLNTLTWNAEAKGWSFLMQQKNAAGKWELFAEDRLRRLS